MNETNQHDYLVIKGAREHNLKNINLRLPKNRLIVISGLSGSGKSSLAFDTIFAEGQRRYVESLSPYARQFLGQMNKSDVDSIEGLSPAISIEQKSTHNNPRSTVGTLTEIYDHYRLIFARIGKQHCPECGRELTSVDTDQIIDFVYKIKEGTPVAIAAPVVIQEKGEWKSLLEDARREGYTRVFIDDNMVDLQDRIPRLEKNIKHTISIVVDRLRVNKEDRMRLSGSVETALGLAHDKVEIATFKEDGSFDHKEIFSRKGTCPICGITPQALEPRLFSFNSPIGACPKCSGLGVLNDFDPNKIIPDMSKSFNEGGVVTNNPDTRYGRLGIDELAKTMGFSLSEPLSKLTPDQLDALLYGSAGHCTLSYQTYTTEGKTVIHSHFPVIIPDLKRRMRMAYPSAKPWYESFCTELPCPECGGKRLNKDALAVTVGGKNIIELTELTVKGNLDFLNSLELTENEKKIGEEAIAAVKEKLTFLKDVGLEYLTLSRQAGTLSGGEAQRIRLATQLGSSLSGVLYVLDEPSIGLHQRDNERLIDTLCHLRDLQNTVVVVEHDEETIRKADYVVDMGPGAGVNGGYVVAAGTPKEVEDNKDSLTGAYLSGREKIEVPKIRRKGNGKSLVFKGCKKNNLKNIDVSIPLGTFTVITGVSGSGKSTLLCDIITPAIEDRLFRKKESFSGFKSIKGIENIDKLVNIDQSPIGRTPRSNPATYIKLFDKIRDLYASLPESKMRGFLPGRFSFNVPGGRCEACKGDGEIKVEMHFLNDVYVPCDVCNGKRFNKETLSVLYKGKSIADVLDMTMAEAGEFFKAHSSIKRIIDTVNSVGLGYIKLGQSALDLSGGEAQRVKLSLELSKVSTGKTLYILDEPTTGLHFKDVQMLIDVLSRLVDAGNTVVVIEHNLDVIKSADYIIDLGKDGGENGGTIIAKGTPEEIAKCKDSYTGKYLKEVLK